MNRSKRARQKNEEAKCEGIRDTRNASQVFGLSNEADNSALYPRLKTGSIRLDFALTCQVWILWIKNEDQQLKELLDFLSGSVDFVLASRPRQQSMAQTWERSYFSPPLNRTHHFSVTPKLRVLIDSCDSCFCVKAQAVPSVRLSDSSIYWQE